LLRCLLQFLVWPERDLLARRNLDRLAGRRVPPNSRRQRPYLQDTETGQANFVALLEMLDGEVTRSPSTASATFFGRSCGPANSAAKCLSVTVTWGAAFTGAAAFLAGAAAFFSGTAFFAAMAALVAGGPF
jgi:hypothetical protein